MRVRVHKNTFCKIYMIFSPRSCIILLNCIANPSLFFGSDSQSTSSCPGSEVTFECTVKNAERLLWNVDLPNSRVLNIGAEFSSVESPRVISFLGGAIEVFLTFVESTTISSILEVTLSAEFDQATVSCFLSAGFILLNESETLYVTGIILLNYFKKLSTTVYIATVIYSFMNK